MRILPVLTLLLLTTILPELLTGSTPLVSFLNPGLLLFLGLAYGLVILLIRELAVRHDVRLRGLIFFGLKVQTYALSLGLAFSSRAGQQSELRGILPGEGNLLQFEG